MPCRQGQGGLQSPNSSAKVDAPEIMKVTGINRVSNVWSLRGLARRAKVRGGCTNVNCGVETEDELL